MILLKAGGKHEGTWVHPSALDNLRDWCLRPKRKRDGSGYVYAATSPLIPIVKIGMWTGSIDNLRKRYTTPYGPDLQLTVKCVADVVMAEAQLHKQFAVHNLGGELFCKNMLNEYLLAIKSCS